MPVPFELLQPGGKYTRHELAKPWGYAGIEVISRGVVSPANDNKIILLVTRQTRAEDTQYRDALVGTVLLWEGVNDHVAKNARSIPLDMVTSFTFSTARNTATR